MKPIHWFNLLMAAAVWVVFLAALGGCAGLVGVAIDWLESSLPQAADTAPARMPYLPAD